MKVLIPLADGVEEMEAVVLIDLLRRADIRVTAASLGATREVVASHGVRLLADALWDEIAPSAFDALALPGGGACTQVLIADRRVQAAIRAFADAKKLLAAICAAPLALQAAGALDGVAATCHPSVAAELTRAETRDMRVVKTPGIITGQGPGAGMEFALAIIERLAGRAAAERVAAGILPPPGLTW